METIQELIDKAISLEDIDHIKSYKWKPSLFGRCFRAQYWARKGEAESNPVDRRTLRVFKAGKLFHDFVQGLLGGQREVLIESDDVKGYADVVRDNEVVDIKSQHSKAFWYMAKYKAPGDVIADKYPNWLQVMYYARELKKEFGRLIFVSKDDLCIKEFVQPFDEYWLEQIDTELRQLRHNWALQELPSAKPRCYMDKDGKSKECGYCNFRDKCAEIEARNEKNVAD